MTVGLSRGGVDHTPAAERQVLQGQRPRDGLERLVEALPKLQRLQPRRPLDAVDRLVELPPFPPPAQQVGLVGLVGKLVFFFGFGVHIVALLPGAARKVAQLLLVFSPVLYKSIGSLCSLEGYLHTETIKWLGRVRRRSRGVRV